MHEHQADAISKIIMQAESAQSLCTWEGSELPRRLLFPSKLLTLATAVKSLLLAPLRRILDQKGCTYLHLQIHSMEEEDASIQAFL